MTVPVDEINSISGMLEPGDIIDLMVTMERNGKRITFALLQSVQVMATGQRSVDDAAAGEKRSYSTVTLDTTPQQAQNIIVAREAGKLTALLRNPQDKALMGKGSYDIAALLGQGNAPVGNVARERRGVPVIYGGNAAKLPPEALHLQKYAPRDRQDDTAPLAPLQRTVSAVIN